VDFPSLPSNPFPFFPLTGASSDALAYLFPTETVHVGDNRTCHHLQSPFQQGGLESDANKGISAPLHTSSCPFHRLGLPEGLIRPEPAAASIVITNSGDLTVNPGEPWSILI
jgi:hypothetical protein